MKYKFYVGDIPEPYPIWRYIRENTNITDYYESMTPSVDASDLLTLKHDLDLNLLFEAVDEMQTKFGFKGWLSASGESKDYGGLGLVYNPDYKEAVDLNQQTLGTRTNQLNEFYYGQIGKFNSIKNTYFDSYAYRKLAPCVTETKMKDFMDGFKRHKLRSRLATINSKYVPVNRRQSYGWHKDEYVFENLRINIPIKTDETFLFQIVDKPSTHLSVGNAYSWDTNIPHRVYPTTGEDRSRTHLVLGFSPWFDYDDEEDSFTSNEFYGELHPIDMLISGHVHDKITGLQ